jgi:LysM repeat protein
MKQWKRLVYYLILNVLVSALATFSVLYFWDRTHPGWASGPLPLALSATGQQVTEAVERTEAPAGTAEPTGGVPPPTPTEKQATEPPKSVEEYRVQANDTLGAIASQFGLSVEELMEVNALTDPNSLSVGMVLYIPTTPVETPTPDEPAPTRTRPASTGETTPSKPPQETRVVINSVIGAGDLATERVFITRLGEQEISLADWTLEDEDGNRFTFPQLVLYKDGAVNVWTASGTATVVDLYWGLTQAVWESGETVTLKDTDGQVQATYTIP